MVMAMLMTMMVMRMMMLIDGPPPAPPPPGRGQRPAAEEHFELLATPAAMATTVDGDAGRFKPYACDAATGMGVSPGGGGGYTQMLAFNSIR